MLELTILVITCVLNGILGLLVFYKNPLSATNRCFLGLTFSLIVWSSVNYMSVHPAGLSQLVWVRLVLCFAALLCLMIYLTFDVFPRYAFENYNDWHRALILYSLLIMGLTLTPFVFQDLRPGAEGASPVPGVGVVFFITLIGGLLIGGIVNLVRKYRVATGRQRAQLLLIMAGLAGAFGLIFLTNLVIVIGFNNTVLIPFGPSFTLIFTAAMAYSIVKYRLFDIRWAATRGLAYVLTLGLLASIYALTVFGLSTLILKQETVTFRSQLINTLTALTLALSFQPIKRFFDRLSNRIFYRDAYDPQKFLEELNRVFVQQTTVAGLLRSCAIIIENNFKANNCAFVVQKTAYVATRVVSTSRTRYTTKNVTDVEALVKPIRQKVIAADYLENKLAATGTALNEMNVAVVIRLTPHIHRHADALGEIMLGPKKTGDSYTKQDIELLEIVANELVIAMQNALRFEEIENFNATLQAKVNEATRKIRRANEKLKQMDETKDDFISMASHQLRTPLTSVKGYISMVLEEDAGKITHMQREMLGQAFFSSQRMVYLIADLLNVSRLKTGKFIIERAPVQLDLIVQQEMRQLQETATARSLKLEYEPPTDFPTMMLDETKTRQIIMNFIDNAIYYTPSGGTIKVKLLNKLQTVELRVEDDGIGVPKEEQAHLFTKFYRAGNARKARPDGTGLGLYMAKKVIVTQGGSLLFESKEGQGSTFGFVFSKSLASDDASGQNQAVLHDVPVTPEP